MTECKIGDRTYALMVDRIAALEAERDKLREIVAELADEVEADIKARYCHPDGTLVHESYRRKLDCDMEFVSQARAALAGKEGE